MKHISTLFPILMLLFSSFSLSGQWVSGILIGPDGNFVDKGTKVNATIMVFKNGAEVIYELTTEVTVQDRGFMTKWLNMPNTIDVSNTDEVSYRFSVEIEGETIETPTQLWPSGFRSIVAARSEFSGSASALGNILAEAEDGIPFLMSGTKDGEDADYEPINIPDASEGTPFLINKSESGVVLEVDEFMAEWNNFSQTLPDADEVIIGIVDGKPIFSEDPLQPYPVDPGNYFINVSPDGPQYIESPYPAELPDGEEDWYTFTLSEGMANVVLDPLNQFNEPLDDGFFVFNSQDGVLSPKLDNRPFPPLEPGTYYINVDEFGGATNENYELFITPQDPGSFCVQVDDTGKPGYKPTCNLPETNPSFQGETTIFYDAEGKATLRPNQIGGPPLVDIFTGTTPIVEKTLAQIQSDIDNNMVNTNEVYMDPETGKHYQVNCRPLPDLDDPNSFDFLYYATELAPETQPFWRDNGAGCRILDDGPQECTQINGSVKFEGAETTNFFDFTDGFGYYAIMGDGVICADEYFLNPPGFTEDQVKSGKSLNNILSLWNAKSGSKNDFVNNMEVAFPNLVRKVDYAKIDGGGLKTKVNLHGLTPIITKAISEQQEIIESQQKQIQDQQKQIDELRAMVLKMME